jgi:hypothetical protein
MANTIVDARWESMEAPSRFQDAAEKKPNRILSMSIFGQFFFFFFFVRKVNTTYFALALVSMLM